MKGLILNGTKIQHYLSGDADDDRFINKDDLSTGHKNLLESCYHQGQCDNDCNEAADYFELKDYKKARKFLQEVGIEEVESKSDRDVLIYYLWLLSGDLHDDGFFEPEESESDDDDETAYQYKLVREGNLK